MTGLSKESLNELVNRRLRTFEFRSVNNVLAFSELDVGDMVFLTEVPPSDLRPGQSGRIAAVKSYDIRMQHVYYGAGSFCEEADTMSTRAQLAFHSPGRIKSVEKLDPYKPVHLDIIEVKFSEAK